MASFKSYFRHLYATFGYPLTHRHGLSSDALTAVGRRLAVRIPAALRDYCLIAGRERRFNTSHNRILPPREWKIDKRRLIFMDENQVVVRWGVSVRNSRSDNPPVSQGINGEPIAWYPEHRKCPVFLAVMLHYNAVSGGFRFCARANAPENPGYRLEDRGWTCYGEVNALRAYSRRHQVLCLLPPCELPFMDKWSVLVGGKTGADLSAITEELGVTGDLT